MLLQITLKNKQPVELVDLTRSFLAVAQEYRFHALRIGEVTTEDDVKLYVEGFRSGSIIAELSAAVPALMPMVNDINSVGQFLAYMRGAYNLLTGRETSEKPLDLDVPSLERLAQIVEPVAKDNGSQMIIGTINIDELNITINHTDANAAQNAARRMISEQREPQTGLHHKCLLYWYQARNDTKSSSGERAVIEKLWRPPVRTIFADERIKAMFMQAEGYPFSAAFVVDVEVQTIQGKPRLYTITALHDVVDRED